VSGKASVDNSALAAAGIPVSDLAKLEAQIDRLIEIRELSKTTTPSPRPAFALEAMQLGAVGNHLNATLTHSVPSTGSGQSFDLAVTLMEQFLNLQIQQTDAAGDPDPNFLETRLASSSVVVVEPPSGGSYLLPKAYPGTAGDGSDLLALVGGDASTAASAEAEDQAGGHAFTVTAKEMGAHGDNVSVSILVDGTSFSMTVRLEETYEGVETNEELPDGSANPNYIENHLSTSYLVNFRGSAGTVLFPAEGIYAFSGGKDAAAARTLLVTQ
jgi:hypothetical protein